MPRFNITFLNKANVKAYRRAMRRGGQAALQDIANTVLHPLDSVVYPISALAYDLTIAGTAMIGAAAVSEDDDTLPDSAEFAVLKNVLGSNPQAVIDAQARLRVRYEGLKAAGRDFLDSDGPGKTEKATRLAGNILPRIFYQSCKGGLQSQEIWHVF